jgi:hypothetical protein
MEQRRSIGFAQRVERRMTAMLRLLLAVALVVAGVSPASAQRGGGRGASGGRSGSFVSAPAFRGGAAPIGHPGMIAAPQYRGSMVGNSPTFRMPVRGQNHDFDDHRGGFAQDYRYRRTYVPFYGVGLPYNVGWLGSDYLDSDYDNSSYAAAPQPAASLADQYGAPSPNDYVTPSPYDQPPPMERAEAAPSAAFRPGYQRALPEPAAEDAVTLVFKDGRPSEQIHNYMLTQTTLYVQDQRRHQIAVADIDVPATEKVNRDAGIDFQLPAGSSSNCDCSGRFLSG